MAKSAPSFSKISFILTLFLAQQVLLSKSMRPVQIWREDKFQLKLVLGQKLLLLPVVIYIHLFVITKSIFHRDALIKTSQELRMLSSVTLNCQVTKIVMDSGSQLSEL